MTPGASSSFNPKTITIMNKANDYETLLELANKDLKKYNLQVSLVATDNDDYTVKIDRLDDNGAVIGSEDFAGGYYEYELAPLINEAWVHARAKGEAERQSKLPKLDRTMRLFCESVQEITLHAWPIIWADNKYDQDSREVLDTIREWAWEFEYWWTGHDQDYIDTHDYLEEIWAFTDKKCKEYLEGLGVETEPEQKKWIVRITRVEKYEGDVLVTAASQKEAEEKVADAWQDDEYQWLYEGLTGCMNCDRQTYTATPATDGAHWDFDLTSYKPRG